MFHEQFAPQLEGVKDGMHWMEPGRGFLGWAEHHFPPSRRANRHGRDHPHAAHESPRGQCEAAWVGKSARTVIELRDGVWQ